MTYQPPEGYQPSPDYNPVKPDPTQPDVAYPTGPTDAAPPAADHREEVRRQALDDVRHTRTRAAWVGLIVGALVTLILLIFIVQNLDSQNIDLFFWTVNLPVGVSLLIAAILGAVITAIVGSLRMLQVRRAVKKARP
ncbi:putative integral membrane protein [Williamsia limnetica]|jgi:uncharacterized integral membrane protein|uniref:Putative integral membrane protein n=1 Tax=Williamsia limnetica TaxID=882452 RepID=A0A318RV42_WILLI|nr:lipopolysaccharide assembly protein LapA domain-containing protein [Williamsia limnetica]PYE13328.1 putative integral membrane protein [Williamsia limnetica]